MTVDRFTPVTVEFIPGTLEEGTLYISEPFDVAAHLCPCGCRQEVVTPLGPAQWTLLRDAGEVTLEPSIGNWSIPCRSHYFIRRNRVLWAGPWSQEEVAAGHERDQRLLAAHYDVRSADSEPKRVGVVQRIRAWLRGLFRR